MKYDLLEPFKEYLNENLSANTAKKYYSSVKKVLGNLEFDSIKELRIEELKREMQHISTKNEFSAAKNGLKHLKRLYPGLELPEEEFFRAASLRKRNRTKKRGKVIPVDTIKRKINQLSNDRFKLAYRLALVSGLRVSELADLEGRDITFREDGRIEVVVRNGKGGHGGGVVCMRDAYLYGRLKAHCEANPNGKLFYSEAYLREKADALGMECHDLRRIFAITYRNEKKKEMPIEEANRLTQESLRHVRFSTTKRYLFNRKLKFRIQKRRTENEEGARHGEHGKRTE